MSQIDIEFKGPYAKYAMDLLIKEYNKAVFIGKCLYPHYCE